MAVVLIPLGWGLIVTGVGIAATSVAALMAHYNALDFRRMPVGDPITEEEIRREIERIRKGNQQQQDHPRQPQPQPERRPPLPRIRLDRDTETESETTVRQRARRRCHEEEGNCPSCPPAEDGTVVMHSFQAGTIERPSYRAIGSVYQHHIVPWYHFGATVSSFSGDERLHLSIEELQWKGGRQASWDGLDYLACELIECKFGYGKYVDPNVLLRRPNDAPDEPRRGGRRDATLRRAVGRQLVAQGNKVKEEQDAGRLVWLKWVCSNPNVASVVGIMAAQEQFYFISTEHIPMTYGAILEEVNEIDMRTSDPSEDYGNWRG